MYRRPLTGITNMHLGQAGVDLNNVYLKYHTGALTAQVTLRTCSYLHKSQDSTFLFSGSMGHPLVYFRFTMEQFEHVPLMIVI